MQEQNKGARFDDFNDAGTKTFSVYQSFTLEKDEAIYGLGQLQNGKMSQRNQTKRLIQDNLEDVIPFFQSVKGYGLFWDNYSPTIFKDNQEETSFLSEVGDCIDYYFMYGENADGVVARCATSQDKCPCFHYGHMDYWQSVNATKSQKRDCWRSAKIPRTGCAPRWNYPGLEILGKQLPVERNGFFERRILRPKK